MSVTFSKMSEEVYIGKCFDETIGEIYRSLGTDHWKIRFGYNPTINVKYVNLIDAKKAFENMCLRGIEDEYEVDFYD